MATKKDLRAYLAKYVRQKKRTEVLAEELAWLTGATDATQMIGDALGREIKINPKAAKVVERLGDELQKAIDQCVTIEGWFDSIEDVDVRAVMECHYLSGETLEKTGESIHYSLSTVKRLHRRGLEELEKYYTAE